jgi:TolB protein
LNWFNDEEVLYYSNTGGIYKISIASHERFIISTLSTMDIAISPNGEKIIATQEDTSKISGHGMDLYIMDQNGLKHRKLTNKGYNAEPCWSTDGKHIVFTSNRDGRGEIYIMDAEGKNQKRLTFTDEGNSYNPIWISQYRE